MANLLANTFKQSPRLALSIAALALVGCASSGPQTALTDLPNIESPPKLVVGTAGKNQLEWDDPSKFGRVPQNLSQRGDSICSILGRNVVALGYHPAALDAAGSVIPGGGFLCGRI